MPELYGKKWDRKNLMPYMGDIRQVGGAQPMVLDQGPERGVRAIEVRTGTGFSFWVLPDRGMDIWRAEYNGASLCWHSAAGPIHPGLYEPDGVGWLWGFYGGMLVTCGLSYMGAANTDQGRNLGLHGRASYTPSYENGIKQGWDGNQFNIEITGKIRETCFWGSQIVLSRTIRTVLGSNTFTLSDEIENCGHEAQPHMVLYHINAGFPLLDENAELLSPTTKAEPFDAEAEKEKEKYASFLPPTAGFAERCYRHSLKSGKDGKSLIAMVNRKFSKGQGLGYSLRFPTSQMPCFTEWKQMGAGLYVVGTEPGNLNPTAREKLRRENRLPMIQPGEKKKYEIEYTVLTSNEDIKQVEKEIKGIAK